MFDEDLILYGAASGFMEPVMNDTGNPVMDCIADTADTLANTIMGAAGGSILGGILDGLIG